MRTHLLLLLLSGSLLCAAQSDSTRTLGPLIHFASVVHDYGTIDKGADGRCTYDFTNNGDAPLIITACRSSCGCVVASCSREPVMPGGVGSVSVRYDTNRIGPVRKTVTVWSNAVNEPTVVLHLKGEVKGAP